MELSISIFIQLNSTKCSLCYNLKTKGKILTNERKLFKLRFLFAGKMKFVCFDVNQFGIINQICQVF